MKESRVVISTLVSSIGKAIYNSPLFIVHKPKLDKWREVIHFGASETPGKSFNDAIPQEMKSIYYSSPLDLLTLCLDMNFITIRDHKSAFNQVPIHLSQVHLNGFCFNDGTSRKAFLDLTGPFGQADMPRLYILFPKSLIVYLTKKHPSLYTRQATIPQYTLDNPPSINTKPNPWLNSAEYGIVSHRISRISIIILYD